LSIELDEKQMPTIGANGFLIRRNILQSCSVEDYLFDIDILWEVLNTHWEIHGNILRKKESKMSHKVKPRVAKVKTGIIHIFSGDIRTFSRKQKRRIKDYLYYNDLGVRKYPWKSTSTVKLLKFVLYTLCIFPLFFQSLKGYK